MSRSFTLAIVLALGACARHESPAPSASPATTPAPAAPSSAAESPASAPAQTAPPAAAQETSGEGDSDHQARSDASLEKIAALPPGAQLPTGKWQPGVNYDPLVPAQPTSVAPGKIEVLEVFWLACPHCYSLEPFLRSWLKSKPAYVEFVRVPVMWQPMHRAHAHLYYTIEALGRPELMNKAFDTIHQDVESRVPPLIGDSDEETFKVEQQWAVKNGVSADEFARAYNSFTVNSNLQRAEEITQRYRVQGVPLIAVNGKYTTDVAKAGGEVKLIDLINDLVASEHAH